MDDNKTLYIASLCAAASLAFIWKWRRDGNKPPFPPGPKRLPLLGNVLDIPKDVPIWRAFTSMAKKHNTDVLYLRLLATDFIVLNSSGTISDLCEKRSNIYSDKPRIPMVDLMGHDTWAMGVMEYGSLWRNSRRVLHEFLNLRAVTKLDDYQRKHAHRLLLHLVESPDRFLDHAKFAIAGLVMEVTYGMNITSPADHFLQAAEEAVEVTKRALVPGTFLVDTLPILKHIPGWFPGAGFKRFAKAAREQFNRVVDEPLEYVKATMKANGSGNASIAWSCFYRAKERTNQGFDENAIRAATRSMYAAAVETTVSVLQTLFMAMVLNPHVVKKAQEELDRVVGSGRLPDFSDQGDLPYISAVTKELLRWTCPFPIGLPKRVMKDDIYNRVLQS